MLDEKRVFCVDEEDGETEKNDEGSSASRISSSSSSSSKSSSSSSSSSERRRRNGMRRGSRMQTRAIDPAVALAVAQQNLSLALVFAASSVSAPSSP